MCVSFSAYHFYQADEINISLAANLYHLLQTPWFSHPLPCVLVPLSFFIMFLRHLFPPSSYAILYLPPSLLFHLLSPHHVISFSSPCFLCCYLVSCSSVTFSLPVYTYPFLFCCCFCALSFPRVVKVSVLSLCSVLFLYLCPFVCYSFPLYSNVVFSPFIFLLFFLYFCTFLSFLSSCSYAIFFPHLFLLCSYPFMAQHLWCSSYPIRLIFFSELMVFFVLTFLFFFHSVD